MEVIVVENVGIPGLALYWPYDDLLWLVPSAAALNERMVSRGRSNLYRVGFDRSRSVMTFPSLSLTERVRRSSMVASCKATSAVSCQYLWLFIEVVTYLV
jgi:hypothetical protein